MSKGRLLLGVGVGVKLQGPFLEVTGSEALLLELVEFPGPAVRLVAILGAF